MSAWNLVKQRPTWKSKKSEKEPACFGRPGMEPKSRLPRVARPLPAARPSVAKAVTPRQLVGAEAVGV